jgi:hypothetical protein
MSTVTTQTDIGPAEISHALTFAGLSADASIDRDGDWMVTLRLDVDEDLRPTRDAWLAIEFVTWFARDVVRGQSLSSERPALEFWTHSAPPFLNRPGHCLTFCFGANQQRYTLLNFATDLVGSWNANVDSPKLDLPAPGVVAPEPTPEDLVRRTLASLDITASDAQVARLVTSTSHIADPAPRSGAIAEAALMGLFGPA